MLPERIFAVRKVFYDVPAVRALLAEDHGCQIDEISDRDVLDAIASWAEDDLEAIPLDGTTVHWEISSTSRVWREPVDEIFAER